MMGRNASPSLASTGESEKHMVNVTFANGEEVEFQCACLKELAVLIAVHLKTLVDCIYLLSSKGGSRNKDNLWNDRGSRELPPPGNDVTAVLLTNTDLSRWQPRVWVGVIDAHLSYYDDAVLDRIRGLGYLTSQMRRDMLCEAVGSGYRRTAKALIVETSIRDVNEADSLGRMPLLLAAHRESNASLVKALLEKRAEIEVRDEVRMRTALHVAAEKANISVTRALLDKRADAGCQDKPGYTPLHLASIEGNCDIVKEILKSRETDFKIVVRARDEEGRTAVHWALMRGHIAIARALIGEPSVRDASFVMIGDKWGRTPLHWAVVSADADDIVEKLLEVHNNETRAVDVYGRTPLHWVADKYWVANKRFPRIPIMNMLLKCDPEMISARDKQGRTCLHAAALGGPLDMVEALLEARANVGMRDYKGRTALHLAVMQKRTNITDALMPWCSDDILESPDGAGANALMMEKSSRDEDLVRSLEEMAE